MKQLWPSLVGFAASLSLASAATFTVTNTNDSGAGSYRQAILDANVNPDADTINFNITGSGVQTVAPFTAFPAITNIVTINGYSQPGSSANTLTNGDNASILIRLDGVNLGATLSPGVYFNGASGSSARGLIIVRFGYGVQLLKASNCVVAGNWIGLDFDGVARGNSFNGVDVSGNPSTPAAGVLIGGLEPADRNVISGNGNGIMFFGFGLSNCFVLGNYIGTDATGSLPRGNTFDGVLVQNSTSIAIGGSAVGAGNVVSASTSARGISLLGGGDHLVQGNLIGSDATGQYALGNFGEGILLQGANRVRVVDNQIVNNRANGIRVLGGHNEVIEGNFIGTDSTFARPLGNAQGGITINGSTNRIGGRGQGQGNVIQFNGGAGVSVTAMDAAQNEISGNRIYNNSGLGIDLVPPTGVTANDPNDADFGANQLQNFPVLTSATSAYGSTQVQGTLNSAFSATFRLEFFASPPFDATGNTEGQLFLGSTNVMTDGIGDVSFDVILPNASPTNYIVTATATDTNGNTSEFSAGFAATSGPQDVSLTIVPASNNTAIVTWPGAAVLDQLETSKALNPTSQWQTVTSGVVDVGLWKSYSVTNTGGSNQFFRLKRQQP